MDRIVAEMEVRRGVRGVLAGGGVKKGRTLRNVGQGGGNLKTRSSFRCATGDKFGANGLLVAIA